MLFNAIVVKEVSFYTNVIFVMNVKNLIFYLDVINVFNVKNLLG